MIFYFSLPPLTFHYRELSAADIRYKNMVASIEDMNREKAVMNQTAREVQEASSAMIKYYLYIFYLFL